jgi:hypothetical protein
VLAQLRASGKLIRGDEEPSFALAEVVKAVSEAVEKTELRAAPRDYLVLMIRAQLEVTVEFIHAHPEAAAVCREWGFKMLWKELSGK